VPIQEVLRRGEKYSHWNGEFSEFEAIFEMALAHESGPKGGLFDEKKPRVENLVTLPL
jgi:hypothetical protein